MVKQLVAEQQDMKQKLLQTTQGFVKPEQQDLQGGGDPGQGAQQRQGNPLKPPKPKSVRKPGAPPNKREPAHTQHSFHHGSSGQSPSGRVPSINARKTKFQDIEEEAS